MNDRTHPTPPQPLLSRAQLEELKSELRLVIHEQVRAQLEAERSREAREADAQRRRKIRNRRSPRERFMNRRRGHCPNCGEIRVYEVHASKGRRLRDQKCQSIVCGATLGPGSNRRALKIDDMLRAARDDTRRAKREANRRSGSGSSGSRSGGLQRVTVRDVLPFDVEHSDGAVRVDVSATRI